MTFLHRFWNRFRSWLTGQPKPHRTLYVEDLPTTLQQNCVYVVGENEFYWSIAMICPCGCDEVLYMNLLQKRRPNWSFTKEADGTISMTPSVWRKKGCQSHFFFRRGHVEWCGSISVE